MWSCWLHWDWFRVLVGGPTSCRLEGVGLGVFFWAGSEGGICMSAWEWLRPGRGEAHGSSGKAEGRGERAPGNLRLRWASSDGGVQAVRSPYREPGAQECSEAGPSQSPCQAQSLYCLPAGQGALQVKICALLHHKPVPASFPNPDFKHRITVQASPGLDRRRNVFEVGSGDSPTFPRFRAIQCKKLCCPVPFPHRLSSVKPLNPFFSSFFFFR